MPAQPDLQAWADELQRLLGLALEARQSGETARIVDVQNQLRQFCDDSPKAAQALDDVAMRASLDLALSQSDAAIAGLQARAAELQALTKLIVGVAASAQADADVLSGKTATAAIEAATNAIGAFKQLRAQLTAADADTQAIAASIDKTLAAVQALRNRLEKA